MSDERERRRRPRYVATFPVAVESQGKFVFVTRARNVASGGIQVMLGAELEVGELVTVTYHTGRGHEGAHDLEGRIVRVERNGGDGAEEWPYLAAVEFEGELEQLAAALGGQLIEADD